MILYKIFLGTQTTTGSTLGWISSSLFKRAIVSVDDSMLYMAEVEGAKGGVQNSFGELIHSVNTLKI